MAIFKYRQCPNCSEIMRTSAVQIDAEEGYRYWSDGKADGGMFPVIVQSGICPACKSPFRFGDASRVSKVGRGRRISNTVLPLDSEGFRTMLNRLEKGGPSGAEKHLRIEWWRHLNDAVRPGHKRIAPLNSIRERELPGNLSRLAELLDESQPEELLLKAELLRESGQFDMALRLLVNAPPKLRWLATHLSIHAASGNEQLFGLLKSRDGWEPILPKTNDNANTVA